MQMIIHYVKIVDLLPNFRLKSTEYTVLAGNYDNIACYMEMMLQLCIDSDYIDAEGAKEPLVDEIIDFVSTSGKECLFYAENFSNAVHICCQFQ